MLKIERYIEDVKYIKDIEIHKILRKRYINKALRYFKSLHILNKLSFILLTKF